MEADSRGESWAPPKKKAGIAAERTGKFRLDVSDVGMDTTNPFFAAGGLAKLFQLVQQTLILCTDAG